MSSSARRLLCLAAAFMAAPLAAQTCPSSGPYRQGDCQPAHRSPVPNSPLSASGSRGVSTVGYLFEQRPGPPMRAWYSFDVADFYGSLVHVGATLPALNAMDVANDGQVWYVRPGADWGTIDAEGLATPRGGMQSDGQFDFLIDLALNPVSGEAYVATIKNLPDDAISRLYKLDLQTGVMTRVGDMGNGWMVSIAFNCQGELYAEDVRDDTLYRVDPLTAARTAIGPTGIDAQFDQSISFDRSDGTLYSIAYFGNGNNSWGRFDTATGAFTQIAQDPNRLGYFRAKLGGACPATPDLLFADGFEAAQSRLR